MARAKMPSLDAQSHTLLPALPPGIPWPLPGSFAGPEAGGGQDSPRGKTRVLGAKARTRHGPEMASPGRVRLSEGGHYQADTFSALAGRGVSPTTRPWGRVWSCLSTLAPATAHRAFQGDRV